MNNYDVIIFDLDGTLSNSKEGITKSVQYALSKFGIEEPDLDKLEHFIGPPLVDELMKSYDFTREQALEGVEFYREIQAYRNIWNRNISGNWRNAWNVKE